MNQDEKCVLCVSVQEDGAADLLGLQAGVPVLPASLAAATQPGFPPVATQ